MIPAPQQISPPSPAPLSDNHEQRNHPPQSLTSTTPQPPSRPSSPVTILRDYTSISETTFPPQAKDIIWPGGAVKTKLPWISDPKNPESNLLLNVGFFFKFLNFFVDEITG